MKENILSNKESEVVKFMKKSFLYPGIIAITVLVIGTGILAYANAPKAKTFTGIDGKEITMQVKPGDLVIYSKYSGTEVKYNEEEYVIVKQDD